MAELLTIGQVADEVGLATSALRYYDLRGLVEPTTRVSGQRRYDPEVLRRLRVIELCQRAGFTLAEIEQLLDGAGDWRTLAEDKLAELDRRIRELRDAGVWCRPRSTATARTSRAATTRLTRPRSASAGRGGTATTWMRSASSWRGGSPPDGTGSRGVGSGSLQVVGGLVRASPPRGIV